MSGWLLLLLLLVTTHAVKGGVRPKTSRHLEDDDCFTCHIARLEVLVEEESATDELVDPAYLCITQSPRASYDITLSEYLLEKYKEEIEEGVAHVCIPGGHLSEDSSSVIVPNERRLRLVENSPANQRRLQLEARLGNKKLLAVRVVSIIGEEPAETLADITGAIFGAAPLGTQVQSNEYAQNSTVVSQYRQVSAGALNLLPASGPGIEFGVVQVVVDTVIAGGAVRRVTNAIVAAAEAQLGGSLDEIADFVVFCLPSDSLLQGTTAWTAFTFLYEPYSYYQRSRCTRLSVVMHEMGHGFGFRHSGRGDSEYADESGYMGFAHNRIGWPRKAFNGHKHWISGWFSGRSVIANPSQQAVGGRLVAFVDYLNQDLQEEDAVLVRVGNLYIQYNRAKGYNAETNANQDKVTITEAEGSDQVSYALAGLSVGESYAYPNFENSAHDLIIEVCAMGELSFDYALLSIYSNYGFQTSVCDSPNAFGYSTEEPAAIVQNDEPDANVQNDEPDANVLPIEPAFGEFQNSLGGFPSSFGQMEEEEEATSVQNIVGIEAFQNVATIEALPVVRQKRIRTAERPGSKLSYIV